MAKSRSFAPPSVLPDISPARGEIGSFGAAVSPATSKIGETGGDGAISPLEGEMSGWTEGGNVERRRGSFSHPRRFAGLLAPAFAAMATLSSSPAFAHASDRGHILLLPTGYYLGGGAAAVAASFLALALLPARALDRIAKARLTVGTLPKRGRMLASLLSFACLAGLVYAGVFGSRDPLSNPLPLVVWTLFWIGLTIVHGLVGNLWAWLNPWYGPWRTIYRLTGREPDTPPLRLPEPVGYWPAIIQFLAFAWFELVYPAPDDPARLAAAVSTYWAVNFIAMLVFGHAEWARRGECLSAFLGMVSRFSIAAAEPVPGEDRTRLSLGWPGAKLRGAPRLPASGALFLLLALSTVSFDGLSKTFFWLGLNDINPLEYPGRSAVMALNSAGLLAAFAALSVLFFGAVLAGQRLARGATPVREAAGLLVWSIVPIALAYHFSHYLIAFAVNGQYALVALSDPLGRGWDLFGTAGLHVAPGIVAGSESARTIWNLQAAAIIGGHVVAVLAAHMLAGRLHPTRGTTTASQLPLTGLMVGYTLFGLWLLSTPTAG